MTAPFRLYEHAEGAAQQKLLPRDKTETGPSGAAPTRNAVQGRPGPGDPGSSVTLTCLSRLQRLHQPADVREVDSGGGRVDQPRTHEDQASDLHVHFTSG